MAVLNKLELVRRIRDGEISGAGAAREYGVSRQRIDQIVSAIDPQATRLGEVVRRVQRRERREVAYAIELVSLPDCRVCFGPMQRRPRGMSESDRGHTCSPHCAKLWRIARFHLDEGERRRPNRGRVYSPRVAAALEEVARLRSSHS